MFGLAKLDDFPDDSPEQEIVAVEWFQEQKLWVGIE
jgi:hypothetical protein